MYDKIAKSLRRRKLLCVLLSLLSLGLGFIPLRALTVPLGIILCFVIYFFASLLLVARPINRVLLYEMDAEKFLYLSYELGYGSDICDMYADYYRGRYDKAIEIINQSMPKTKRSLFKYEYSLQLAYCYFESGDMDGLARILEEIDLIPCESKNEISLKKDSAFILEFLKKFTNGEYAACKEMKIAEVCNEDIRSVPAIINRIRLYHGIACYMNGDTEEANTVLSEVINSCSGIYFSKIARYYVTGEKEDEKQEDSFFATIGDLKRQNCKAASLRKNKNIKAKKTIIAAAIIVAIPVIILASLGLLDSCDVFSSPADAYTIIAENEDITRVVDIVPINTEGDALCIYLSDGQYISGITHGGYYSQILGIAYLNRVGDDLYRYGTSVKFQQAEKRVDSSLYKISAPDIGKDVYFKIVSDKKDVPADTMIKKEFYVHDKTYYLCYICVKDSESSEYSYEAVPNEPDLSK
ncbi:MAG: hypothetical protein IKC74_04305 [Clostridia bacterium]|nr:hypothetical protein [Clostridia bacterium]